MSAPVLCALVALGLVYGAIMVAVIRMNRQTARLTADTAAKWEEVRRLNADTARIQRETAANWRQVAELRRNRSRS